MIPVVDKDTLLCSDKKRSYSKRKYLEGYLAWRHLLDTQTNISVEHLLGIISKRQMICQPLTWI